MYKVKLWAPANNNKLFACNSLWCELQMISLELSEKKNEIEEGRKTGNHLCRLQMIVCVSCRCNEDRTSSAEYIIEHWAWKWNSDMIKRQWMISFGIKLPYDFLFRLLLYIEPTWMLYIMNKIQQQQDKFNPNHGLFIIIYYYSANGKVLQCYQNQRTCICTRAVSMPYAWN